MSALFTPLSIRGIELRNRLWVSPMCQYSAVEGVPNDWHHVHLAQFAAGGAGLVIAEATAVSPEGRISPQDAGLWTDAQAEAWRPVVAAIRARGAVAGVQLGHAGRKASTSAPLSGARGSVAVADGGWRTVAPSAIAYADFAEPAALDADGIEKVVTDFADAARRAVDAGFQVLELHAAHGYLLHQFLSPLTNHRDDAYGGSFENRTRLLVRVTEAVRAAAPEAAVFVRFSATDAAEGGWSVDDTVAASRLVAEAGADLIDVSSGGLVPQQRIVPGPGYQVEYAATVRRETGLLVSAVGMIDDPALAENVIADGRADAVMSAREWLRDPHYALRAAAALGADSPAPAQYLRAY
ncbi:NADH:flavin oxidoreductase/NADH oxidase [Microbacterium sp. KSW2-29]|uniref:NADH:flavin oxidoreductase/NADH oxidase n=1 Tax=Microbacterium phycohabitans TaxID=3075993 RepID=A0ABU3SHU1_9MICO|nr:NADH:flavin oxidoreductase/NADH oxidase [Microbacterium sp. KSW2-29]MDU0344363.1 NADH:flavin oxidoreductase/NADH oxidase [Microbacterium sp. KSW2-29]